MSNESLLTEIACKRCGQPQVVKDVIRKEKLGFMEQTASEALEKEHLKLAQTEKDPFQAEIHKQLAIAQAKMQKEGLVKLELRCPNHPGKADYSFLYEDLAKNAPLIKQQLFRCLKCGNPVTLEGTKTSGSYKVLSIRCSQHGSGERKISTVIHDTIMQALTEAEPTFITPVPQTESSPQPSDPIQGPADAVEMKFCWNCGTPVAMKTSQYCYKCGVTLKPP
jgi:hypothetical protein